MNPLDVMATDRVVAVIRARQVPDPAGLAGTLASAGIRTVEFTFTIPDAAEVIRAATASGAVVGAGTVLTRQQADQALGAGARFLVSPTLLPGLSQIAGDVPVILGGFTPTEIHSAVEAGAAAVKLFPARIGGPAYLRDLAGPFPDLRLIPSGGVTEANAADYLAAGAMAVYAGSSLAPAELIEAGDHSAIRQRARAFVAALR
ncbi:MAG: 2-dehydro-3-deoxy-phosphogluconate aldolase [Acidimicrobiia bacterium]|nr:MAG: 2-dehydro-3-deoxy-phosphogluconate aldolase [Acidimicrobiia bacterium]